MWIRDPANLEHRRTAEAILSDTSVGIGSRAFRAFAISSADAAADPLLAPYAKRTAILTVSRENVVESVLVDSRMTPADVFTAMVAAAGKAYADDLRVAVTTTREAREELARVTTERKALAEERLDDATRKARAEALDSRQRAAEDRERHAWPLKVRTA